MFHSRFVWKQKNRLWGAVMTLGTPTSASRLEYLDTPDEIIFPLHLRPPFGDPLKREEEFATIIAYSHKKVKLLNFLGYFILGFFEIKLKGQPIPL